MSEHSILDAVLDNTQIPHQPLVVIVDSAVFSGLPLFRESLRRALNRPGPIVLVTALHDPIQLPCQGATVVNLGATNFKSETDDTDITQQILTAYKQSSQVYIDAVDIIAEDHGSTAALKIVRSLLQHIKNDKAPSRLTLLLPHTSPFLSNLYPPTFSPALTLLHPYHPSVLTHLSRSYLLPIDSSPMFTTTLDRARDRQLPEKLAYGGLDGVEVQGDWTQKGSVVSVLVRKATGGVKGISRSLASIKASENGTTLVVGDVGDVVPLNPIDAPGSTTGNGKGPAVTHIDLNLPFNLSLTDEQKRRRGEVPLPYAHEGEGVSIEFGEEEDDDDED